MKQRILITGSTGFIGKNIKEKFENKYDIVAPDRKELDLTNTEAVREYVKEQRFDVVIHSANTNNTKYKNVAPFDVLERNLRMFYNLANCSEWYGKMFYYGSGAEYDMEHYIPKMKEEYFGTHIPKDGYGLSKYVMSKVCEHARNIYDLRLFGVYGKYEEWDRRFISNAICRALTGRDITMQKHVYFDYLWVEDLCNIMEWFVEHDPKHKHYNVCRGTSIDLYTLACMVREILNIECNIVIGEEGWKPEYSGNNTRLLKEIGEYPFIGYRESIQKLCDYYKENIDIIEESKLM